MTQPTTGSGEPNDEDLEVVRAMLVEGRGLDAWRAVQRFAPLEAWRSPRARLTAAHVCDDLGAPKRARAIELATIRRSPRAATSRVLRLQTILRTRSPFEAWLAATREPPLDEGARAEDRAEIPFLAAQALTSLRDFDRAADAAREAEHLGAVPRRVALLRVRIDSERDRYPEALATLEAARAASPLSTDLVQATAYLRVLVGDGDGALALLREHAARSQCADLAGHLVAMLHERGLFEERAEWVERWAERVPLLEDADKLAAMRADAAYDLGDLGAALRRAREVKGAKFHARVAARLEATMGDPRAKRVLLDVPFVRQHHMTCGPATLTALARFWNVPAEHLEIAEAICYDGTPSHSQRAWAEGHGFVARELTVTWDAARALLDRGVPFTVTIAQSGMAHLQALVGYDARRGTLFLRDPFVPGVLEALAEEWLGEWRATGPQGMVLVPAAEAARIDGLDLPDAALHDELHRVHAALGRHDRGAARAACDALVDRAPGHRLATAARRALAGYDQDAERVLACAEESAKAFPDFVTSRLDAFACMRALRPRAERVALATELAAAKPTEALYAEALAMELADDAREHARAEALLRRAMRARPDRHVALGSLAAIRWGQHRWEEALALRRFATCVGRFDEDAAAAYFASAAARGRDGEALVLLRARAETLGARRAAPLATLFRALEQLGRSDEGFRAIDAALADRPDDGDLLLLAADHRAAYGELDAARELLARAEGRTRRAEWLRTASRAALRAAAFEERKKHLEELLAIEPLDVGAHVAYASALAATDGIAAAGAHLAGAWSRAPHLRPLARAYVEAQRDPVSTEKGARAVLAVDPSDAWMHRQLAIALLEQGRVADGRAALDASAQLAPKDPSLAHVRAVFDRREGRKDEARAALLAALDAEPDRAQAIVDLVGLADDRAQRDEALDAVQRVVFARASGAGVGAWYVASRPVRDPKALAASLDALRAARPSVWVAWSCAIRQRTFVGDHEGAVALAREACERFPLVAPLWSEHAEALAAAGRNDDATSALERAVQLDTQSEGDHLRLAAAYVRVGSRARARGLLTRAVGRMPESVPLRTELAELAWSDGAKDEALAMVEAAIALLPEDATAWNLLDRWTSERGDAPRAMERMEALAAARPWSAAAALGVARGRARRNDLRGALEATERALAADPRAQDAHDFKATILGLAGKWDDAEAACAPPVFGGDVPRELRGRAAWVRAQKGDLAGAIEAMRALVADHQDYAWGWNQLATWGRQAGRVEIVVEAARALAAVAPRAAGAHHVLAEALFATGDRPGARRALARAVDLDPTDVDVVGALFGAALEDGDLDAAEPLVPLLTAASPAHGRCADVRLRARRGDADGAIAALRALATHPGVHPATLERARVACVLAGLADRCASLYAELLDDPSAHASVGEVWARDRALGGDFAIAKAFDRRDPKLAAVRAAARAWLACAVEDGAQGRRVEAARSLRARFERCDDALWGDVAGAFVTGGELVDAVGWTRDWRERPAATSWALLNAASARREVGLDDEAFDIVRRGAALASDGATRSHRTWLAFELALRGDRDEARRWLAERGDVKDVPLLVAVGELTEAVLAAQERGVRALGEVRRLVASARGKTPFAVLVRARRRATERIARDLGFPLGTAWRYRRPLVVAAALVAVPCLLLLVLGSSASPPSTRGSASGDTSLPVAPIVWVAVAIGMRLAAQRRRR